jgi:hypothetical protein
MIKPLLICVPLVAALTIGGTDAQAFRVIGTGNDSCGTWTADRRVGGRAAGQDQQWILGFLSGISYEGSEDVDTLKGMDAEGVFAWMDNYCQAHPIEDIIDAGEAFKRMHPH